jgi:beta-N-acetylhexosaminidase
MNMTNSHRDKPAELASEACPGPVLIGIAGTTLSDAERRWLANPVVGGVVLFTRNFASLGQLQALNSAIRAAAHAPMLLCVDHEGGRVQRFREGFTVLPPLALLGRMYLDAPDTACDFAYRHGRVMATELLVAGVDMSFAPVLDIDVDSCVIGDRSFSAQPDTVAALGAHYLAGMHDAGMKTCGKHFPGHGSVHADSHTDDVIDNRQLALIEANDLQPFVQLLPQLDSLMMAHVVYPDVDDLPAGYSPRWIKQRLRQQLGYTGVVFSDDLGMHAAACAGTLANRLQLSLEAGCDAVLVCHPDDVHSLFAQLEGQALPPVPGLLALAGNNTLAAGELATVGEWRHWQQSIKELEQTKWA